MVLACYFKEYHRNIMAHFQNAQSMCVERETHLCGCAALSFIRDVVQVVKLLVTLGHALSRRTHRLGRVSFLHLTPDTQRQAQ